MMSATLAQEMVPPGCRLSLPTSINPIRNSLTDMTRGFYVIFRSCQVDNCLSQGRTVHVEGAESESARAGMWPWRWLLACCSPYDSFPIAWCPGAKVLSTRCQSSVHDTKLSLDWEMSWPRHSWNPRTMHVQNDKSALKHRQADSGRML